MSWEENTSATTRMAIIDAAAWSPCDRFIAIIWYDAMEIEVLDSVTLRRLQALRFPQEVDKDTCYRALAFSPDSRILTFIGTYPWHTLVVWDLQTGGVATDIRWMGPCKSVTERPSIAYSANGQMVAVRCWYSSGHDAIRVFDIGSNIRTHSHSSTNSIAHTNDIWTHRESLRFTAIGIETITIWEVGFTSDAIPTEVETLPTPEDVDFRDWDKDRTQRDILFLPALYRLAFVLQSKVAVWDARNAKYLLDCADPGFYPAMSFSSDGRFFTCSTHKLKVYLWKESPNGYILHHIFTSTPSKCPLFSQNGESIVEFLASTIRLLRTQGFTTPPSSPLTQTPQHTGSFLLEFSPDGILATYARQGGETVTVLSLKSGAPQLTIDTGVEVEGHGVAGNAVVVINDWKVITWDLPTGDRFPYATMTLADSARTIDLGDSPPATVCDVSISPDSCNVALVVWEGEGEEVGVWVYIYDGLTGERLMRHALPNDRHETPFFVPGGRDLWLGEHRGHGKVLRVGDGEQVLQGPGSRVDIDHPPDGYPWVSPCGYRITDDWWVLGPEGKRLLMLPPPWQHHRALERMWKGQFLALLHGELLEPVILELEK